MLDTESLTTKAADVAATLGAIREVLGGNPELNDLALARGFVALDNLASMAAKLLSDLNEAADAKPDGGT